MPKFVTIIPMVILGLIFLQGLLNVINPRLSWRIFESWKAKEEPAGSYFFARRVLGVVSMLIVVALFLFPYVMSRIDL